MDPFLGEIRIFSGNYAPYNWALCDGQLLSIQQYSALFSLLGIYYGGDGKVTFALPDLRGRAPMNFGQGPGLTPRVLGETDGSASVMLISSELPPHNHTAGCVTTSANQPSPVDAVWATTSGGKGGGTPVGYQATANTQMNPQALTVTGGSQPHNNMQPYLGINFIIALVGVFPQRP